MKKREKLPMDCFRAVWYANWLAVGGVLVAMLGVFLVSQLGSWWWLIVSLPGVPLIAAGYRLYERRVRCPGCGRVLATLGRYSMELPGFCPYCGKDIRFL
ncbi:MAG: hypothetical protein HFF17_10105 [Oscillospiraceae bacterium]|nr:hypothetical protein [Oscillospiraceae bacterium]